MKCLLIHGGTQVYQDRAVASIERTLSAVDFEVLAHFCRKDPVERLAAESASLLKVVEARSGSF
jgi:hypothetical protein